MTEARVTEARVVAVLRDVLAAEAHVIGSEPALLRQQVCNRLERLARDDAGLRSVLDRERATRRRPWLRRVNAPRESDELVRTIPTGQGGIVGATLMPGTLHLATRGRDGTTAVWDLRTGARADGATAAVPPDDDAQADEPPILRFTGASGEHLAAVVARVSRRVIVVAPATRLAEVDVGDWGTQGFADRVLEAVYLAGHVGDVRCLTAVPAVGGRLLLASGAEDTSVRLWDPTTGDELARLTGHAAAVVFVGAAAGGVATIVSASLDDTIRLWRVLPGRRRGAGVGHHGAVTAAAMSADGGRAATGGEDGATIVWDFTRDMPAWSSAGFREAVHAVALDADGTTAAISLVDGTGVLWDVERDVEVQGGTWDWPVFDGAGFVVDMPTGRRRLVARRRLLGGTRWVEEAAPAAARPPGADARGAGALLVVSSCRFPCAARVTATAGNDGLGRFVAGDEQGNVYVLQRVEATLPPGP